MLRGCFKTLEKKRETIIKQAISCAVALLNHGSNRSMTQFTMALLRAE